MPEKNHVCMAAAMDSNTLLSGTRMLWPCMVIPFRGLALSRVDDTFYFQISSYPDIRERSRWIDMCNVNGHGNRLVKSWGGSSSIWELMSAWETLEVSLRTAS